MKQIFLSVLGLAALAFGQSGILIEAESFAQKGGWKVDPQFVQQMGSPYLLAHGMGQPVADASTSVEIPEAGNYRVWVRTKNWVPGPWAAPGRFRVAVNGAPLTAEFGQCDGWGWEDGGTVELPAGATSLVLQDLTGFDGRCDAIFLTRNEQVPPNEFTALEAWRVRLSEQPDMLPSAGEYDLVIIGGGMTGCAAALAADHQGMRVALIHDRMVLGGNASSEVRVHAEGIYGKNAQMLVPISTGHWPNGSADALLDDERRHETMEATENVKLMLGWRAFGVEMDGSKIVAVKARHIESDEAVTVSAPIFIDCTGDGWIGFWAGADYRYGRESRDEFGEGWEKHGELWSPKEPDNRVMGASLLWSSREAATPVAFPAVPWALPVAKTHAAVHGEWYWEYSDHKMNAIDDAEAIRDHMLRAIYGSFFNAKQKTEYANSELEWVGYISGKRESRRLLGDYIYTLKDAASGTWFPDTVAREKRNIDVHYQRILKHENQPDFLSEANFWKAPEFYYIPFRTLYSRNIDNLMMAGRCFSCSHIGLGGPRVMKTCAQMGLATGYAASLCVQYDQSPRGVYEQHLDELRQLVGETAPPVK